MAKQKDIKFKDNSDKYQLILRPNYEKNITIGWLGAAATLYVMSKSSALPFMPTSIMIGAAGLFGAYYLSKSIAIDRNQSKLKGSPLTKITFEQLRKLVHKKAEENLLWLGDGYGWNRHHTQMASEIINDGQASGLIDITKPNDFGQPWLHGLDDRDAIWQNLKHAEGHTLITGTTGSGKTRIFDLLISQAIIRREAVIIIDAKGDKEMMENARYACEQLGIGNKFVIFHPAFPEQSVRINPLRNYTRPSELSSRLANLIKEDSDFKSFGWQALDNVIQIFDMLGQRITIKWTKRLLEDTKNSLGDLVIDAVKFWAEKHGHINLATNAEQFKLEMVAKAAMANKGGKTVVNFSKAEVYASYYQEKMTLSTPFSSDIDSLISMFRHDQTHFSKMVASLLPILKQLTGGSIGDLLSPDVDDNSDERIVIDSSMVIREKLVFYVGLDSLSDSIVGQQAGSLLLSDLASVAGARYNFGIGDGIVNIFVDEAAEVINDPMIQVLNKGRGSGFRMTIATQTFADFAARLGDENKARQVLANCNNIITLRLVDSVTQEYVVKGLPDVMIKSRKLTQGTNTAAENPLSFGATISEQLGEAAAPMIHPAYLALLPNLEFFAVISGGNVYKGKLPILERS